MYDLILIYVSAGIGYWLGVYDDTPLNKNDSRKEQTKLQIIFSITLAFLITILFWFVVLIHKLLIQLEVVSKHVR